MEKENEKIENKLEKEEELKKIRSDRMYMGGRVTTNDC